MHVDRPGQVHGAIDHRAAQQLLPSGAVAGAEDELRRVLGGGELHEGGGDVGSGHLVELATDVLEQLAVLIEQLGGRTGETFFPADVDAEQLAVGALGDAGGTPNQRLGARCSGDGDDDTLPGLPRLGDPVTLAILLEADVDLVGDPQQSKLAQGAEIAGSEVVGQRGVDLVGGVDVAVNHPPAQRLGRDVDHLDLLGRTDDLVGNRLALFDAGDPLDDVVERFEVLDVERRRHVDAGGEDLLDVLPALLVAAARDVGVGELVDEHPFRTTGDDGVDVHLLERRAAIDDLLARHDLEVADRLGGQGAVVRLDESDDDVARRVRAARLPSLSMAKVLPTPGAAPR